jgi:aspartate-semialdehyde dehydrogenase
MVLRKKYSVAIVGATGAVGTEMLRVLKERKFPVSKIRLLASERSAGRSIAWNGIRHRVERLAPRSFEGIDVALFSAGALRSLEFGPEAIRRGAVVVDNSSAFRMDPAVPLVVPEVNPHALRAHQGLIANPNCSTIVMVVALKPLHDAARIRRIIVSTYQSVSGAGAKAMAQLYQETRCVLRQFQVSSFKFHVKPKLETRNSKLETPLPAQIAFNVIPQIDAFLDNGYTKEEMKMVHETRKILEAPDLPISATCVRVPVFISHSEAVWIETERTLTPQAARRLLSKAPGVRVIDDSKPRGYPMPIDAGSRDEVLVGRIRADLSAHAGASFSHALTLWVSGDNLRKGAATNAVQIAELLISRSVGR